MKSFGNAAALEDGKAAAIAMTTDVELSPTLQFDYRFVVFEVVLAVIVHLATLTLFARWTIVNFRAIRQAASMTNQIVANNTSLYSNVPAQTVSSIWSCVQVQSLPMEIQDVLTNVTLWNKAENGCTLHRTTIGLGIFDLSVIIAECLINLLCLSILILVSPRRMAARKAKGVSQGPSNEKDSSTIGRQEISSDNTDVKESADRQSEDLPHYYAGGTSVGPPSYKTSSYASSTSSTPSVLS
ncbi:hypothetical protein BGZ54_005313 [Gamsiella multidivaricata]|nr:hypothetical protein BGZ54_005313 [Gamsiella multidivaricata]